jgi:hypothetical protein
MANSIRKHHLRVDAEVSKVSEEIRRSQYRDNITLHQSPAANLNAIIRGLNDHRPRIVHFSGHGNAGGLATDDGGVRREAPRPTICASKDFRDGLRAFGANPP